MFDPYHKWLGIPKDRQPPTHYQLLGLQPGEDDPEVIEEAAIRQSVHLRTYQLGPHAAHCTKLLNEIAEAKNVLLNPTKRAAYYAQLSRATQGEPVAAAMSAPATLLKSPAKEAVTTVRASRIEEDEGEAEEDDVDFTRQKKRKKKGRRIARDPKWLAIKVAAASAAVVLLVAGVTTGIVFALRDRPEPPRPVVAQNPPIKPVPNVVPNVKPPVVVDDPVRPKEKVVAKVVPQPVPAGGRFVDHGDYVEDTQTHLWWQKDGSASGRLNFYQAAKYSTDVKLGGKYGWRVPTIEELKAIFPAADAPFENTKYNPNKRGGAGAFDAYWTSNFDDSDADYAYLYEWSDQGGANNCFASRNTAYVRCVREPNVERAPDMDRALMAANLAEGFPKGRFIDRKDHVEDTKTGMLWQKDGAVSGRLNFFDAMKYAASQKIGGVYGWRVPSKYELAEIFPALHPPFENTQYSPMRNGPNYWTSTLDRGGPDYAYIFTWSDKGGANNGFASRNFAFVRCVHDPIKK